MKVLKYGISQTAALDADAKVRATVEQIITDIGARGDKAVRELSATILIGGRPPRSGFRQATSRTSSPACPDR